MQHQHHTRNNNHLYQQHQHSLRDSDHTYSKQNTQEMLTIFILPLKVYVNIFAHESVLCIFLHGNKFSNSWLDTLTIKVGPVNIFDDTFTCFWVSLIVNILKYELLNLCPSRIFPLTKSKHHVTHVSNHTIVYTILSFSEKLQPFFVFSGFFYHSAHIPGTILSTIIQV